MIFVNTVIMCWSPEITADIRPFSVVENQHAFPSLLPPFQVSVSSTAGDIVGAQRSQLLPENSDMFIFLKKNVTISWQGSVGVDSSQLCIMLEGTHSFNYKLKAHT